MQPTEKKFENVFGIEGMNIILTRIGQNDISEDDEVVVKSILQLPCKSGYLIESLRFEQRLKIFNETLYSTWGNQLNENVRYNSKTHKAQTWKTAFDNAEDYAFQEASYLKKAIYMRKQALLDAEKDD